MAEAFSPRTHHQAPGSGGAPQIGLEGPWSVPAETGGGGGGGEEGEA